MQHLQRTALQLTRTADSRSVPALELWTATVVQALTGTLCENVPRSLTRLAKARALAADSTIEISAETRRRWDNEPGYLLAG